MNVCKVASRIRLPGTIYSYSIKNGLLPLDC